MGKLFKAFLIFLILFATLIIGVWAYSKYYKLAYSDKEYGFIVKDQRGWYSVPPREGVYYSLGTAESEKGKVISYFGVSPIIKKAPTNKEKDFEAFKQACSDNFAEHGKSNLSNSELVINNLEGFVCSFEGIPEQVPEMYVMKQYLLLNEDDKLYDYMVFLSYPANDLDEKEKVDRIVNSFYAQ